MVSLTRKKYVLDEFLVKSSEKYVEGFESNTNSRTQSLKKNFFAKKGVTKKLSTNGRERE